jgi:hypothetical protein
MLAKTSSPRRETRFSWSIVAGIGLLSGGCPAGGPDTSASRPGARLDDQLPSCELVTTRYQITALEASPRRGVRCDLDDDGRGENALGNAADALAAFDPRFAIGPRLAPRLHDDLIWLLAIDQCADGSDARVTLEQAMTMAGGAELPRVLPRAVGTVRDGVLTARDGIGRIPVIALADAIATTRNPGWTTGEGLRVDGVLSADGATLTATIGVALRTDTLRAAIAAPIAAFLTALPDDDLLRVAADANHDGKVTAAELTATTTFHGLTGGDVEIFAPDGTPRTTAEATSLALKVTAVRLP